MHTIQCPSCGRKFRLAQPVINGKLKCSKCGQSFVGTSVEEDQAAPSGGRPQSPAAQPAPAPALAAMRAAIPAGRRKGNPALVAGILAVTVLALGGIGYAIFHLSNRVEIVDPKTGSHTYVTKDEFARQQAEQKRKAGEEAEKEAAAAAAKLAKATPAARPNVRRPAGSQASTNPGETPGENTTENTAANPPPVPPPAADPNIQMGDPKTIERLAAGKTFLVGTFKNLTDKPLAEVKIQPLLQGNPITLEGTKQSISASYKFIPAHGQSRYCIELPPTSPPIDASKVDLKVQSTPLEGGQYVWNINKDVKLDQGEDSPMVAGFIKNTNPTPVKNVRIYCEFFDAEGVQGGSAQGALKNEVGAGKTEKITPFAAGSTVGTDYTIEARAVAEPY